MFILIKILLVGIPESVELLAFGAGLVVSTGVIRWFLSRGEAAKPEEKV